MQSPLIADKSNVSIGSRWRLTSSAAARVNASLRLFGAVMDPDATVEVVDLYTRRAFNVPDKVGVLLPNGAAFAVHLDELTCES